MASTAATLPQSFLAAVWHVCGLMMQRWTSASAAVRAARARLCTASRVLLAGNSGASVVALAASLSDGRDALNGAPRVAEPPRRRLWSDPRRLRGRAADDVATSAQQKKVRIVLNGLV